MKYLLTYYILKTLFPMIVHFFKSQYAMEKDNRSIKTTAQIPGVITKYSAHNCHIFTLAYANNHVEADTITNLSTHHSRGVTLTLHSLKCMKSQRSQSQAHGHPPRPTA